MIELTLPYPLSANRYWATRVIKSKHTGKPMAMTYVTPEAEAYKEACQWAVSRVIKAPLPGRVAVEVLLYPKRPQDWATRARKDPHAWDDTVMCIDLDNANKVLLDALKGVAIEDDRWVRELHAKRMEPDGEARVVVRITPLHVERAQVDLLGEAA